MAEAKKTEDPNFALLHERSPDELIRIVADGTWNEAALVPLLSTEAQLAYVQARLHALAAAGAIFVTLRSDAFKSFSDLDARISAAVAENNRLRENAERLAERKRDWPTRWGKVARLWRIPAYKQSVSATRDIHEGAEKAVRTAAAQVQTSWLQYFDQQAHGVWCLHVQTLGAIWLKLYKNPDNRMKKLLPPTTDPSIN